MWLLLDLRDLDPFHILHPNNFHLLLAVNSAAVINRTEDNIFQLQLFLKLELCLIIPIFLPRHGHAAEPMFETEPTLFSLLIVAAIYTLAFLYTPCKFVVYSSNRYCKNQKPEDSRASCTCSERCRLSD